MNACTHIQKVFYSLPTKDVVRFDLGHLLFESGNENVDGQTDGPRTHQSNWRVGYTRR